MDDLFACQEQIPEYINGEDQDMSVEYGQQQQEATHNLIFTDGKSYEDPTLLKDHKRILSNILKRQNKSGVQVDYFRSVQTEVKPHMRKIVTDWMLEVCEEQQCHPEVFFHAVNYMDRFLCHINIAKNQFQLLASTCLFLASKFKESVPLPAENLVLYTDNSITTLEILEWEMVVLQVLQWDLSAATSYSVLDHLLRHFLTKLQKHNQQKNNFNCETVRQHAETLLALAATEYAFIAESPALVGVACLASALRGLNVVDLPAILSKLESITKVQMEKIRQVMTTVELSIGLSMSGVSAQPVEAQQLTAKVEIIEQQEANNNVNHIQPGSKVIPQEPSEPFMQSSTPTDLMEIAATCVY